MIYLRQSTDSQECIIGPFLDDTDGKTAETGLTIANTDLKVWKAGATTEVSKNSGGGTHIAGGRYSIVLNATDTDTLGSGEINCHVSGALPCKVQFTVLPANVFDALVLGSDLLDANTAQWLGSTAPAMTGDAYARLGAPSGASVSADIAEIPTAAENVAAINSAIPQVDLVHVNGVDFTLQTGLATQSSLDIIDGLIDAIKAVTDKVDGLIEASGTGYNRLKATTLEEAPGITGDVTLAASQPNYAPAKAGDAMTLTSAYDAAKVTPATEANVTSACASVTLAASQPNITLATQTDVTSVGDDVTTVKTDVATIKANVTSAPIEVSIVMGGGGS